MKRRLLSTFTALLMVLSIAAFFPAAAPEPITAAAYTAHTRDEALAWVRSQVGQSIETHDASNMYQCVDFIQAYYVYLGVPMSYGSGKDYATNTLPSGWSRVQGGQPEPGDILVFGASSGNPHGHVAIYEADRIHYHQNFGTHRYVEKITYSYKGLANPYWGYIRPDWNIEPEGTELEVGAGYTIPTGDYWIFSELSSTSYVDISGSDVQAPDGTNVAIWNIENNSMPPEWDVYHVEYLGNSFYKIVQLNTNQCIEVGGFVKTRGANVQTWTYGDAISQQWSIENTARGYKIRSRFNGYYLDVHGGSSNNGTNIAVWESNDTAAQFYGFIPYAPDEKPIENGEYLIKSGLDNSYYLDIVGDAETYKKGSKVQISNKSNDVFQLEYAGDGYYKIIEKTSKLNLEIVNDDVSYLANCQYAQLNNESSIREIYWKIRKNSDGTYSLYNKLSGYPLDVAGGVAGNGKLCQQFAYNGTAAQKWTFEEAHKHNYSSEITTQPTCTEKGLRTFTCDECGDTYTEDIPALGHDFSDEWTIDVEATCTTDGSKSHHCTRCDAKTDETVIPATGHKVVSVLAREATCTQDGNIAYWYCSNCKKYFSDIDCSNEITEADTVIKAKGHTWDEGVVLKPATATENGLMLYTCTVCGAVKTEVIPATGSANPTVTFEKGNNAVKLTWNKVNGAEKYGIAGYVGGKWKLLDIGPATASSYVLKNLKAGTNYKIAIVAMFDGKWNMDFANAIVVTPNAAAEPQYPDISYAVKGSQFRLNWTAVPNAQAYAVAVYQNGWKLLKNCSADTLTYTSAKLTSGTYHIAVAAKVNGKWDTTDIKSRAVTITIK